MSVICVPGNSYIIWMLWVCVNQGWWPRCWPMWCDCEALWVFSQEIFRSYTQQVNCELSKHFSSALHTGYTLPDSFLNSAIPQVWLIFIFLRWRWCWEKWPKLLTSWIEKPNWEPWGGPSVTAVDPWPALTTQLWNPSHGARGSLHLCLCLEVLAAPEVQILPIIISLARWSFNPGQE